MHPLDKFIDGGWKSRKLAVTSGGSLLLLIGAGLTAKWPAMVSVYPAFVGGIVALAGLFMGGNVAAKSIATKVETDSK